jgi:hypothetical protein
LGSAGHPVSWSYLTGLGLVRETTTPAEQSASTFLRRMLADWGVPELYKDAAELVKKGLDADYIVLSLQDTAAYKKRFAANEDRQAKGLPVLSPADYIATEAQYRNVLRTFGLPAGFYDSNEDVRKFLANDLSPAELGQRAQAAQQLFVTGNPEYRRVWKDFYGLSDGDAIAALLDPKRALPIIQQQQAATQIAAAARRQHLDATRTRAEQLASLGVDEATALKGYADIADVMPNDQAIAQRFGQTFTLSEEENDRLLGLASAQRKRRELYSQETALFNAGRGAAGSSALSQSSVGKY